MVSFLTLTFIKQLNNTNTHWTAEQLMILIKTFLTFYAFKIVIRAYVIMISVRLFKSILFMLDGFASHTSREAEHIREQLKRSASAVSGLLDERTVEKWTL